MIYSSPPRGSDQQYIPEDYTTQPTFSDDLEALHGQEAEILIDNNRRGIVIQHRNWKSKEAFRSDDDRSFGLPSSQPQNYRPERQQDSTESTSMPFMSSPVAYPTSSPSPPQCSPKRKRVEQTRRSPLKQTAANNQLAAIFIEESDDDDGDGFPEPIVQPTKRPRLESPARDIILDPTPSQTDLDSACAIDFDKYSDSASYSLSQSHTSDRPALLGSLTLLQTTSGKRINLVKRQSKARISDEQLIGARSEKVQGKAQRSYYGIDIHKLLDEAKAEAVIKEATKEATPLQTVEAVSLPTTRSKKTLMWTEKYRARKFTDLIGDDRTHRAVMHWLKRWDQVVFPGSAKPKPKKGRNDQEFEEKPLRKILLLTGPPGLGKTTLAHVCAKQAGYEVQEINASDERSSNVVRGRIRDMVGTENVRGVDSKTAHGTVRKAARPVCVIVDEVDGVVGGSGGSGEGGFIKALIDLVMLDQRNTRTIGTKDSTTATHITKKKKGDNFRMLRPLVLICNDLYHPSLRPLRQSGHAEVIHVGKPQLNTVVLRMQNIFQKENVPADSDGVRRLCEASWGITSRKQGGSGQGTGEGDIRSIMVVGEWVAGRLRATLDPIDNTAMRLTRRWVEANMLESAAQTGGAVRGLGRGGSKEIVDRVFEDGAGLSKQSVASDHSMPAGITGAKGVAEAHKSRTMQKLREMVDGYGESDRVVSDLFSTYPDQPYQDDNFLTKPNQAYDWLYFHDAMSSANHSSSEWELAPYLSQSVLAFHHLFASSKAMRNRTGASTNTFSQNTSIDIDATSEDEPHPFTGSQASYLAHETQKANTALLQSIHASLTPSLTRLFPAPNALSTDLLPYIIRMLAPYVTPVLVSTSTSNSSGPSSNTTTASVRKASEKLLVSRAVNAMLATGVRFERSRIDTADHTGFMTVPQAAGWVFRMEPSADVFASYETGGKAFGADSKGAGNRYAVRQCLDQECKREERRLNDEGRKKRGGGDGEARIEDEGPVVVPQELEKEKVVRDFFGRVVVEPVRKEGEEETGEAAKRRKKKMLEAKTEGRIWVSFHEGFSNAVRKPITLAELMRGL